MELLHNGFTLELSEGAFPLSTDSIALSGFVKLPKNAAVLDLCSGCGTLGLLLCAKDQSCTVTGIEIDSAAHQMALRNASQNSITDRLTSICMDAAAVHTVIKPGSYHCCVSNPPYFSAGPQSSKTPIARRDDLLSMDALFQSAAWALRYGGDFFLVHRPERLAQLFACGVKHGLEPKRLLLLRHKPDGPVILTLVQCRKGGNTGLVWQEESLYDTQGQPTEYYRNLYHL